MANLEVNWARVMFDTLVREPSTFLPYDAILIHIFRKFKIDLASKNNVVNVFEPFDRSVLLRMKLLKMPPPQPTFPSHGSYRVSQSSTHPTSADAFYDSLSVEISDIRSKQTTMMESQTSIINSQSLILEQFLNLNIRMDQMNSPQQEILCYFQSNIPPPPPPPSGSGV